MKDEKVEMVAKQQQNQDLEMTACCLKVHWGYSLGCKSLGKSACHTTDFHNLHHTNMYILYEIPLSRLDLSFKKFYQTCMFLYYTQILNSTWSHILSMLYNRRFSQVQMPVAVARNTKSFVTNWLDWNCRRITMLTSSWNEFRVRWIQLCKILGSFFTESY